MATANDVGFNQNILATFPDTKDDPNNLPHEFQAQITVPDIDCPTCTLQMIQSMEENPAAPSYYYSCADIAITKTVAAVLPIMPPSSGGSEGTLASTNPSGSSGVKFGQGCGLVKDTSTNPPMDLKWVFLCMITLLIPVLTWKKLKILVTTT